MKIDNRIMKMINHGDTILLSNKNKVLYNGIMLIISDCVFVINYRNKIERLSTILKKYNKYDFEIRRTYKCDNETYNAIQKALKKLDIKKSWFNTRKNNTFLYFYELELELNTKYIDIC